MNFKIKNHRFCINRKIAPHLSLDRFFKLVKRLQLNKIEMRNDINHGNVTDNLSSITVSRLALKYQLKIESINAIYPFNDLNDFIIEKTKKLLIIAKEIGAKSLVLCPLNNGTKISNEKTIIALKTLASFFEEYKIMGLVEPLGFQSSSLRSATLAQRLIKQADVPFKIILDTFHQYLYEKADEEFTSNISVKNIGLVHLSGVTNSLPKHKLSDEDRIMVNKKDILKSKEQVQRLELMGYNGTYSFEPFSSTLLSWNEEKILYEIKSSIQYLND